MIQEVIDKIEREIEIRKNMPHNHEQVDICYGLSRAKEIAETVTDSTKWIPLKERFPNDAESSQRLLVTLKDSTVMALFYCRTESKNKWWDEECNAYGDSEILAWMPTPEPYKP